VVQFPQKKWNNLLQNSLGEKITIKVFIRDANKQWKKYDPFTMYIANEPVDPFICYRLLYPGYESWNEMKVIQRSVESFREKSVFENQLLDHNCVNCHTFNQNDPETFLLHVRGSKSGTYFVDGREIIRRELQTGEMTDNAVYPAWHPSGKYIVFSSNKMIQSYYMNPPKRVEVIDLASSLVIYSPEKNEMKPLPANHSGEFMETYPVWSPTGDYLYSCRTKKLEENFDYKKIQYSLVRKSFDQESGSFGEDELIIDAGETGKSVSFPSISPNGRYLVFVLHNYGFFSSWHKEADLYLFDLHDEKLYDMPINSEESESYHSWSSNSRWLVFSSKRGDGLTARPWFAYIGSPGNIGKPFVLPQKNPGIYQTMTNTFNRPEFITGPISANPRNFARASESEPVKAAWMNYEKD
jgi:hypothetical protein